METLPEGGSWLFDQGADTTFDGDGRAAKTLDKHRSYDDVGDPFVEEPKYRIYSSVTRAEITETNGTGAKAKTSVYLHGKAIAEQIFEGESELVKFNFGDPLVGTEDATDADGVITPYDVDLTQREPLGAYIPTTEAEETGMTNYNKGASPYRPEFQCVIDRVLQPNCKNAKALLMSHSGYIDFLHSDDSAIQALGIIPIWIGKSGRKIPANPNPKTTYGDGGIFTYMLVGSSNINLDGSGSKFGKCDDMLPVTRPPGASVRSNIATTEATVAQLDSAQLKRLANK